MDHSAKQEVVSELNSTTADNLDWEYLRKLSLRPGGFGDERVALWTKLLQVDLSEVPLDGKPTRDGKNDSMDSEMPKVVEPHPDERQVRLDTDRSFVLYPVGDVEEKERRQNQLHDLIVEVFRKRRRLHYFQGYHDIMSVLFLTLPQELQLPVAEKLSLHRLRDSMGLSLEPVLGLLRVLKRVLNNADPEYSATLENAAPLPYYALSNLLTLFSHDVPTLPLVQHVFDYLLCRPPIAVVYLAAAVILSRKEEVKRLEDEGEEGMIHSLLSSLPDLYEDNDENDESTLSASAHPPSGSSMVLPHGREEGSSIAEDPAVSNPATGDVDTADAPSTAPDETVSEDPEVSAASLTEDATLVDDSVHEEKANETQTSVIAEEPTLVEDEKEKSSEIPGESDSVGSPHTASDIADRSEPSATEVLPADGIRRPHIRMSTMLEEADRLFDRFPPTHPSIDLSSIMGPGSVMLTWSENPAHLPKDDEAEMMVTRPHLVVLPPPDEDEDEKDEEVPEEKSPRGHKHKRRRLHKPRRISDLVVQRRVVASAVLVLGVAMAVYGFQVATPDRHHGPASRELKRLGKVLGGFVIGMGGRLFDGLLAMGG